MRERRGRSELTLRLPHPSGEDHIIKLVFYQRKERVLLRHVSLLSHAGLGVATLHKCTGLLREYPCSCVRFAVLMESGYYATLQGFFSAYVGTDVSITDAWTAQSHLLSNKRSKACTAKSST